ncbi:hypothetical protein AX16_003868 [Volvariella volvacea WC 439]|nr:hypothetical protein AX16_003868 [Volvariella volvacea WC 439]
MESTIHSQLHIPRLHFTKTISTYEPSSSTSILQAGPSRLHDKPRLSLTNSNHLSTIESDDGDSDQTATPRVTAASTIRMLGSTGITPAASDAARLRAMVAGRPLGSGLKSFVSNNTPASRSMTPTATNIGRGDMNDSSGKEDESYSEQDSEVDTPFHMSAARESMKKLFDKAMAEPIGSPKRIRRRRSSSIDYGEVDPSPRAETQEPTVRTKRKSASDEEGEHSFKLLKRGEATHRSSVAPFDFIRERLAGLRQPKEQASDTYSVGEGTNDTAAILRDIRRAAPPEATSTPLQSLRMSSATQFQFQSNLLEQDSEMHRAFAGMDSYYVAEGTSHQQPFPAQEIETQSVPVPVHPEATPILDVQSEQSEQSLDVDKTPAASELPKRQRRESKLPIPRRTSISSIGSIDSSFDDTERLKERERDWNRPRPKTAQPGTPESKFTHLHGRLSRGSSPMHVATLTRRTSTASLRSEASSRDGSVISQSDFEERQREVERERNFERERQWNRPKPKTSSPNLGHLRSSSERVRTYSPTSRPGSAQSFYSPDQFRTRTRRLSSTSSRASSPTGSRNGDDDPVVGWEKVKERERNWGAPNPIWTYQPPPSRSSTPSPPPGASPSPLRHNHIHTRSNSDHRSTESPLRPGLSKTSPSPRTSSTLPRARTISSPSPRPNSYHGTRASPHTRRSPGNNALSRPTSQIISRTAASLQEESDTEEPPDRFGPSPTRQKDRPSSQLSHTSRSTMIPVKSPKTNAAKAERDSESPPLPKLKIPLKSSLHPRTARSPVPHDRTRLSACDDSSAPQRASSIQPLSPVPDDENPLLETTTPLNSPPNPEPQPLPPELGTTPPSSPPPPVSAPIESKSSQQQLVSPQANRTVLSPLPSPPLEPSDYDHFSSVLQTPPRNPANLSSPEFETPEVPKGLPALPGPPTSSDEEDSILGDHIPEDKTPNGFPGLDLNDLSSMKTPKPPGAWFATPTPAPVEKENAAHAIPATPTPVSDTIPEGESMITESDSLDRTPAPLQKRLENGLVTPAPSISKGTQLPVQTPALPGGWVPTPAPSARKSILKVRFENPPADSSSEVEMIDDSNFLAPGADMRKGKAVAIQEDSSMDISGISTIKEDDTIRAIHLTNGLAEEVKMPPKKNGSSSPTKKKSVDLKVVDHFGNPVREQERTPPPTPRSHETQRRKKKRGLQIVDAMGRVIDDEDLLEESQVQAELTMRSDDSMDSYVPPIGRNEALLRLRHGLAGLAQELDDIDRSSSKAPQQADQGKMNELNEASRAARKARESIVKDLNSAPQTREATSASSKVKAKGKADPHVRRRLFTFSLRALFFFIVLQIAVGIFMYRLSLSHAQELFFTTYYDPFFADIHLFIVKPYTLPASLSSQLSPWHSLLDTLWSTGWSAFIAELINYVLVLADMGRRFVWEMWGQDSVRSTITWPPT